MRKSKEEEIGENYKGELQTVCMRRGFEPPAYHTEQHGTPHQPIWKVHVQYGEQTYTTPNSIPGSKKYAEQIAVKQVIEHINSQSIPPTLSSQLGGEAVEIREGMKAETNIEATSNPKEEDPIDIQKEIERLSREIDEESLQVSSNLILQCLSLANDWLSRSNRGKKYLHMLDASEVRDLIGLDLADFTLRLVRAFSKSTDRHKIDIIDSSGKESLPESSSQRDT